MTVFPIAMNFIDKKRKRKRVKQEMFENQIFIPGAKLKRVIDVYKGKSEVPKKSDDLYLNLNFNSFDFGR